MKQRLDHRKVKKNRSYTVRQAALLYSVTPKTVRRWITVEGLPVMNDGHGDMIHWQAFKDWIIARNERRKWIPMKPDEIPCPKCKAHRRVKAGTFQIAKSNTQKITLHGDCEDCGKTIRRFDNLSNLDAIQAAFAPDSPSTERAIIAPIGDDLIPVNATLYNHQTPAQN